MDNENIDNCIKELFENLSNGISRTDEIQRKTIKAQDGITAVGSRYGLVAIDNDLNNINIFDVVDSLGEYEDTGMTPSDILKAKEAIKLFYKDFPRNIGKATDMLPVSIFTKIDTSVN